MVSLLSIAHFLIKGDPHPPFISCEEAIITRIGVGNRDTNIRCCAKSEETCKDNHASYSFHEGRFLLWGSWETDEFAVDRPC
jgi:hypothetical protein